MMLMTRGYWNSWRRDAAKGRKRQTTDLAKDKDKLYHRHNFALITTSGKNPGAGILLRAHCQVLTHTPRPPHDVCSDDPESSLLGPFQGCHPESNLHQIPLQGVEGRDAHSSSLHKDLEFLHCAAMFCLWHRNSPCPFLYLSP